MAVSSTVEPIRDRKKIDAIRNFLKGKNPSGRDALLFTLGINSGLRISDLLKLRVADVKNQERITIVEQKKDYLADSGLGAGDYLFPSRKGNGPLQRVQAWKILTAAARAVGIKENIGTHTLRKNLRLPRIPAGDRHIQDHAAFKPQLAEL